MASKANVKKKKKTSFVGSFILSVLAICVFTVIIVFGYVFINAVMTINGEPVINLETARNNQNQTSFLYATGADGKQMEVLRLHGEENRIWVDLDKVPNNMRNAFIALEDKRFTEHKGVDWYRTFGVALKQNGQGGSTLTQQLVKNITGNNEVTYVRKYNEILTALNIEKNFSRDQILEAYLNTVYLGQGCYGVETAAETYFGKEVSELNIAECSVIASITQAPYSFDPMENPENNRDRQLYCLKEMLNQGKINQTQYSEALNYKFILTTDKNYVPSQAEIERKKNRKELETEKSFQSSYIDFVINDVIDRLQEDLGYSYKDATNAIYGGGLRIYTAVDLGIQQKIEDVYLNKTNWQFSQAQSACTVMDYKGRVVAICGQAGEKEGNRVLNRAADSPRPPGSTIKPLSSYAPAIELDKINWFTSIRDYSTYYAGMLWPKNYSGSHGSGSYYPVHEALAESLNTVPARICINMLGVDTSYDYVTNKFHLSTLVDGKDNAPAPLVVGSMTYGVTSLELTAAYCSFGNHGVYYKPYSFYYIENAEGEVLIDNRNPKGEQILSQSTADVMLHLLQTVTTYSSGTGYHYGVSGFPTFMKTGTTDDLKDKWVVGGTAYYCSAVWYGYDTPKTMPTSENPAGIVFRTYMNRIHSDLKYKNFEYLPGKAVYRNGGWFKGDSK
ncbi:MAG: transglycosylase domain-containing protein [Ruminococcus sp.]|nr:transglycosylase domain-containing protein [Candidatus Copronaster equi]